MIGKLTFILILVLTWASSAFAQPVAQTAAPVDPSAIHTDIYRKILPVMEGPAFVMPKFDVCLKHYVTQQCMIGRKHFFSCDSADINQYISCISDPNINKKIAAAYDKMYAAAKDELARMSKDTKIDPVEKKVMVDKLKASLAEYEARGTDDASKLREIDAMLAKSNRLKVAELLKSPEFREKLKQTCATEPGLCLTVDEYRKEGLDLIKEFQTSFKSDPDLAADLQGELEDIRLCESEKLSGQPSTCKQFAPDAEVMKYVNDVLKTPVCGFLNAAKKYDQKTYERLVMVCSDYYQYIKSQSKGQPAGDPKDPVSTVAPVTAAPAIAVAPSPAEKKGEEKKKENGKKGNDKSADAKKGNFSEGKSSGNGWEGGKKGGKNVNRDGWKSDWFTAHIKEEKYKCDKLDTDVKAEDCEDPATDAVVGNEVRDLAADAQEASKVCVDEMSAFDKAQMDAASFMLETQFRAYVDRLNFDKGMTVKKYQEYLEQYITSCEAPAAPLLQGLCDYEGLLQRKSQEYVKSLAAQAMIQRQKIGFEDKLSTAYLADTVKAAQDLKEIDESIKDLLGNFPSKGGSLQDVWPEIFPCQSVVGVIDTIRDDWKNTHYESRCAPLAKASEVPVWDEEEDIFQEMKAVELGLVPGKTLADYPDDKVGHYQYMKKEEGTVNDLDGVASGGAVQRDKKSSSMFLGRVSTTGRVIVEPSTLTGLESRRLECKKKADQVKKLLQMKLSLTANYPQLATKTFADGTRPSKEWVFWDANCRGKNRYALKSSIISGYSETIKKGCEKEPSDWKRQEKTAPLHEQLGSDPSKFADSINKQLSVEDADQDLTSLKNSTKAICKDPLKAGEDVIKDDSLYTLYAKCSLQNVQNGERRVDGDTDSYQFWKPINQSAQSKANCAKRASESINRCYVVRELNSGVAKTLKKGAAALGAPLMKGLDLVGCVAMFTGVGGAVYSGVQAGAKGGITAGIRAGVSYLGKNSINSAKGIFTKAGAGFTAGSLGISYYYSTVAEEDYNRIKGKQAAGLASAEEVEAAKEAYEQAKMSNNLQALIAGTLVPSGANPALEEAVNASYAIRDTASELNSVLRPTNMVEEVATGIPGYSQGRVSRTIAVVGSDEPYASYQVSRTDPNPNYESYEISSGKRATPNTVKREGVAEAPYESYELSQNAPSEEGTVAGKRKTKPQSGVASNADKPGAPKNAIVVGEKTEPIAYPQSASPASSSPIEEGTIDRRPVNSARAQKIAEAHAQASNGSNTSMILESDKKQFVDVVVVKSVTGNQVVADLGRCCSGSHADGGATSAHLKDALEQTENAYFVGTVRNSETPMVRAHKSPDYTFEPMKTPPDIDFAKEFPGMDQVSLQGFEMDEAGKLTGRAKTEAIDYINKNFPDANQYDIEFLAQGGFNAVFKACPKSGGGICKVIKMPGFDKKVVEQVAELSLKLKQAEDNLAITVKKMGAPNLSEADLASIQGDVIRSGRSRDVIRKDLMGQEIKLKRALESYKGDLALIAWGDEALGPGKGPKLKGKEVFVHGHIDRDPKLLGKGLMVQDYYGLKDPPKLGEIQEALQNDFAKAAEGSADQKVMANFGSPKDISAEVRSLYEFVDLCGKAKMKSVLNYCAQMFRVNKIPSQAQFKRNIEASLQALAENHQAVGVAYSDNFGMMRSNITGVQNPMVIQGVVTGAPIFSTIGFDPLGGKNMFFDPATGKIIQIDR